MLIQYREHGDGRYRVWTEQDARYGCFQVLTLTELKVVIRASTLMCFTIRPAEDAECDTVVIDQNEFVTLVRMEQGNGPKPT